MPSRSGLSRLRAMIRSISSSGTMPAIEIAAAGWANWELRCGGALVERGA